MGLQERHVAKPGGVETDGLARVPHLGRHQLDHQPGRPDAVEQEAAQFDEVHHRPGGDMGEVEDNDGPALGVVDGSQDLGPKAHHRARAAEKQEETVVRIVRDLPPQRFEASLILRIEDLRPPRVQVEVEGDLAEDEREKTPDQNGGGPCSFPSFHVGRLMEKGATGRARPLLRAATAPRVEQ